MTTKEYIQEAEENLLHTYNRYSIVLEKGDGVYLYDTDGNRYLDFAAGIAVFAFGYNNKSYNDALKAQIDKLIHTSNLYYNIPAADAAKNSPDCPGWTGYFLPTVERKPLREPLRPHENMHIIKTAVPTMRSLPWNIPFTAEAWGLYR